MTVYGVTMGGSFSGAPNPRRNAFSVRRAPSPQNPAISLTTDTVAYLHCRQRAPSDPRGVVEVRMRPGSDGGFANRHLAGHFGLARDGIRFVLHRRFLRGFALTRGGAFVFSGANLLAQGLHIAA